LRITESIGKRYDFATAGFAEDNADIEAPIKKFRDQQPSDELQKLIVFYASREESRCWMVEGDERAPWSADEHTNGLEIKPRIL
jgi:hypothetical protein